MSKRRNREGLTLIEVLLAAVIMGVGLVALLTAASRCLAVMHIARRYQEAQWALNMGELEHPLFPTDDEQEWAVSETTYDNRVTYSREVEEPDEERQDGLFVLRSRVSWVDKGATRREEVVRYVFVRDKAEL